MNKENMADEQMLHILSISIIYILFEALNSAIWAVVFKNMNENVCSDYSWMRW